MAFWFGASQYAEGQRLYQYNTINNIFIRLYLTTYTYRDIFYMICLKKRKVYGYFGALDVGTSGFLVTLIKNLVFALIRNVTVLIGKNLAVIR